MPSSSDSRAVRGATMIELIVVLAIIITLAGIIIPQFRNYLCEAKAAKLGALYQMVANGTMDFWADTGRYGKEDGELSTEADHTLFFKPSPLMDGWGGPYIDYPLTTEHNSLGTNIIVTDKLADTICGINFDLNGNGSWDVTGGWAVDGNLLIIELDDSPDMCAIQELDALIDGGTMGTPAGTEDDDSDDFDIGYPHANWAMNGRMRYFEGCAFGNPGTKIYIYLFRNE